MAKVDPRDPPILGRQKLGGCWSAVRLNQRVFAVCLAARTKVIPSSHFRRDGCKRKQYSSGINTPLMLQRQIKKLRGVLSTHPSPRPLTQATDHSSKHIQAPRFAFKGAMQSSVGATTPLPHLRPPARVCDCFTQADPPREWVGGSPPPTSATKVVAGTWFGMCQPILDKITAMYPGGL